MTIPASGQAAPYPATVFVTGLGGSISLAEPILNSFDHTFPDDVDVLVVSPAGDKALVISDACGSGDLTNALFHFDSSVLGFSVTDDGPCTRDGFGRIQPGAFDADGNYSTPDVTDGFPGPAPAGPYDSSLGNFFGRNPNGTWSFYVFDDNPIDSGDLSGGVSLFIQTNSYFARIPGAGTSGPSSVYPLLNQDRIGQEEVLFDVNVSSNGFFHTNPDDLDLLLVGPQGQTVVLMSDACGSADVNNVNWTWDDEAAGSMPGAGPCPSGSYRSTNFGAASDSWPAPAPATVSGGGLSSLYWSNPNGNWRIFAVDDAGGDEGFLNNTLQLQLSSRPKATVSFASGATIAEGQSGEVTVQRASSPRLGPASVRVTSTPGTAGQDDFAAIDTTLGFAADETTKTVTLATTGDAGDEVDESLSLTLASPTGDAAIGSPSSAGVTIADDDAPDPGPGPGPGPGGDTTAPETTIDKGPAAKTPKHKAKFKFSADEPATFECSLDSKKKFAPCTSPKKYKRLDDGKHKFFVRATDAAGNVDQTPAKRKWKVV